MHVPAKSPWSHAVVDGASRLRKAEKIVAVLDEWVDWSEADVLDVGTGSGHIARALAAVARSVTSVDVRDERVERRGYSFHQVAGAQLPFADASFDVVVTNHVIEHLRDQRKHIAEIHRVLRPGGSVYLATPNRYTLFEPHHRLPLLSWLPPALADAYLRAARGRRWDIQPLSHRGVLCMVAGSFDPLERTAAVLQRPERYAVDVAPWMKAILLGLPSSVLNLVALAAPTYIFVLRKAADVSPAGAARDR